ncbi:unannotated protein [freshwater metagenome]|uniref:Unannotated protein n=1 Tax=freshwater metagenome TaxID=449393 RepID=A0A6J6ZN86_9ZZZZ
MTEAVHGIRVLGGDVGAQVRVVRRESTDGRLDLAGELAEHQVLVLHLVDEARCLEQTFSVPCPADEAPVGGCERCGIGGDDALHVGHEAVVLRVEHAVDRGEADVLVAATVAGDEVRAQQLVVIEAAAGLVAQGCVGVGLLVVVRDCGVGDVVEERMTGAHCAGGGDRGGDAAFDHGAVAHDQLRHAIRAAEEAAVFIGEYQRHIEDVSVDQADSEAGECLLLHFAPVGDVAGNRAVEQVAGGHRTGVDECVFAQEHLVRRM